jgi:lipopolysaccharide export system permease protein
MTMVDTLNRYVLRQLLLVTVFVTLALTLAIWLTQSLRLIRMIVNQGMSFGTLLELTLLLLPAFMLIILPIALFLAVLNTYNRLLSDREIVVMRVAGRSNIAIAKVALALGVVIGLVVLVLSFYLVPASFRKFKDSEIAIRNDFSALLVQEGRFNSFGSKFTIYVRQREKNGELRGILVQDNRKPEKPVTMMAERGAILPSETGPRIVLLSGNRMEIERKSGRLSYLSFTRYSFELGALTKAQDKRWRQPAERPLAQLLSPDKTSANDRYYYNKLIAEGHSRLVSPLYPLALVIVALVCLLFGEFNKRGQFKRIVLAIVIAGTIQGGAIGLTNFAAKVPWAIVLIYVNAIAPILIGLFLLVREKRRRPVMISGTQADAVG